MAKCSNCGKTTTFGHNRSFSQRATNRKFKPNLQKVTILENGRLVKKTLCARCIKTLSKSAA
jgi:large subunit ribosomal protein L28